jgi:hypothetical protein
VKYILFPSIQYDTQTKDLDTHLLGDESREYLKALFKQSKINSNVDLSQTVTRFGSLLTTVTIHQVQETNENLTSSSLYTVPKNDSSLGLSEAESAPSSFSCHHNEP